jgi:hypothetical protein
MSKFHFPFRLLEKKSEENLADFVGCNYAVKYLQTFEINESIYAAKYFNKMSENVGTREKKDLL